MVHEGAARMGLGGPSGQGCGGLLGEGLNGPDPLMPKPQAPFQPPRLLALLLCVLPLAGCQGTPSAEGQRLNQLELKIQQLETRLNRVSSPQVPPAANGRLPAGAIKSLTYRTSDQGNRLRVYWADGSVTDLECNQEQATLACG